MGGAVDLERPTWTDYVSCPWQCHLDRTPPSQEAGTDYGVAYGTPVVAPAPGVVSWVQNSPANPTGRHYQLDLDDGRCSRSLHLSEVWVVVGQRIARGQQIGVSGASGNGSEWYYGPHVHQTLFPRRAWQDPTIDFELYVGDATPTPTPPPSGGDDEEEKMKGAFYTRASDGATVNLLFNEVSGFYSEHVGGSGSYNNALAKNWETNSWPSITESHARVLKGNLDATRRAATVKVDLAEIPNADDEEVRT